MHRRFCTQSVTGEQVDRGEGGVRLAWSTDNALQNTAKGKTALSFLPRVVVSDSLWFRHSAFCTVHLSLLLCVAGETAAINKTLRWSVHPAVKDWSRSSLHHFGVKANMISHHPLFSFSVQWVQKKKSILYRCGFKDSAAHESFGCHRFN